MSKCCELKFNFDFNYIWKTFENCFVSFAGNPLPKKLEGHAKVCSEKKFTHVCVCYKNCNKFCQKSFKSAKSRHPEDSKLVRQVHIIWKILQENMIEQKIFFCENTIFVKKIIGIKKFTRICEYVVKSDRFSGKSFK